MPPDRNVIPIDHRASSIYRRQDGEWQLVCHHADINAELQGIVQEM